MRWMLSLFLAAHLAACRMGVGQEAAPSAEAAPSSTAAAAPASGAESPEDIVAPDVVASALTETESLDSAAIQLAGVLGVQPDQVRVRIQDSSCSVCTAATRAKLGSLEGLSVEEAASLVGTSTTVWLFVNGLVCEYTLLDDVYTPHACRSGL